MTALVPQTRSTCRVIRLALATPCSGTLFLHSRQLRKLLIRVLLRSSQASGGGRPVLWPLRPQRCAERDDGVVPSRLRLTADVRAFHQLCAHVSRHSFPLRSDLIRPKADVAAVSGKSRPITDLGTAIRRLVDASFQHSGIRSLEFT